VKPSRRRRDVSATGAERQVSSFVTCSFRSTTRMLSDCLTARPGRNQIREFSDTRGCVETSRRAVSMAHRLTVLVPLRVVEREIRRHYVQVGLCLGQGNTRLEPGKDAQKMRIALKFLQIQRQRYPYVKLISRRPPDLSREMVHTRPKRPLSSKFTHISALRSGPPKPPAAPARNRPTQRRRPTAPPSRTE